MLHAQTTQLSNLHEQTILEFLETDNQPQILNQMPDSEIISSVLSSEENNYQTELNEEILKFSKAEGIS